MQIDQPLLFTVIATLCSAIVALFWLVIKAKDTYILYLLETIRYQRAVGGAALGTATRAVEMIERTAG